jgi:hypothetical protein
MENLYHFPISDFLFPSVFLGFDELQAEMAKMKKARK